MATQSLAWTALALAVLLAAVPAATASAFAQADAPLCPAGTIPVGPFCVINPLGGGPGLCPAGTIKVGPFCVIWPF